MITFKQYLAERAMNRKSYEAVLQKYGDNALIGFEVEAFIPDGHEWYKGRSTENTDTATISEISDFSDLENYFAISRRDQYDIDRDIESWVKEKRDAYIDDNWKDFFDEDDEDDSEYDAREKAGEQFDSENEDNTDDYFKEHGAEKIISDYGLDPQYGWKVEGDEFFTEEPPSPDDGNNWNEEAASKVADALGKELDVHVSLSPGDTGWKIVQDTSIEGDEPSEFGHGVEIISPPTPAEKAMHDLEIVFDFMRFHYIETNKSTGLHINMSVPNIKEKLDPLKLVLFMGEEYSLKLFNRLTNTYATPQIKSILDGIKLYGKVPASQAELLDFASMRLAKDAKYKSVNLGKLKQGYLEFRVAGGSDYHLAMDKVKDVIGRWLTAIDIACDPSAEREQYLKKVAKLFGRGIEATNTEEQRQMSLRDVLAKKSSHVAVLYSEHTSPEQFMTTLAQLASAMGDEFRPSFKQVKELKNLMHDKGVSAQDLFDYVDEHHESIPHFIGQRFRDFRKVFNLR